MTRNIVTAAIAFAAGIGGSRFQAAQQVEPVLRANRFELVSPSGKLRGVMEASEDSASIQLLNPNAPGSFVTISASYSAGGSLTLSDHSGKERLALEGDLYGKPALSSFEDKADNTLWLDHQMKLQILPKKGAEWDKNLGMTNRQSQATFGDQ